MRATDQPVPVIAGGDRPGPDVPMGQWPAQLFVGIERVLYENQPVWDASPADVWDDPANLWDEGGTATVQFVDAICWLHGLTIDTGEPDAEGRFTAATATISLDNRDGAWSRYSASGDLIYFPPGHRVALWATLDGDDWWLFYGRVATWVDVDQRVELTAVDAFSELNVRIGEWNPGPRGQAVAARIAAILTTFGHTGPTRIAAGEITLVGTARTTDGSPLEELQLTAESDAGVLYVDADGTIVYANRSWTAGRADQVTVPVLSDNVCAADAILRGVEVTTDDDTITNYVVLASFGDPTSHQVTAEDVVSRDRYGTFTLPQNRDEDLWQTPAQGQAVAQVLVERRGDPLSRIARGELWLHDPGQDLWRIGIDLRRGDVLELVREVLTPGGIHLADVFGICAAIRHDITPDGWIVTLGTSRVTGTRLVTRWDQSPFTWDNASPDNAWSF